MNNEKILGWLRNLLAILFVVLLADWRCVCYIIIHTSNFYNFVIRHTEELFNWDNNVGILIYSRERFYYFKENVLQSQFW